MLYSSFRSAFNTGSIIVRSSNFILTNGLIPQRNGREINEATKLVYLLKHVMSMSSPVSFSHKELIEAVKKWGYKTIVERWNNCPGLEKKEGSCACKSGST